NVDINLWSVTSARQGDAGHGTVPTPTNTRDETVEGGNSLYFGYTPNDNSVSRAASFNGGHDPSPRSAGSYNIAGGAKGAIDSYAIDLSEYSLEDEPMLYFNYFLDSEDASALINSG